MIPYSQAELIRYIESARGESSYIDAKGPMEWDNGKESAKLTKDILAFANSRKGGVIVIGKPDQPGSPEGLSPDELRSFDTTKVAQWVNSRCAPPVHLVCNQVPYDGNDFVVIRVDEFHDVPVICIKDFELPGPKPGKSDVLLRKGAIYVRTANAASEPLTSVEDLRMLIGIATTKRTDEIAAMFQAISQGRPLLPETTDQDRWEQQIEALSADLDVGLGKEATLGRWEQLFHPVALQAERWHDKASLTALLQDHAVLYRDQFPGIQCDLHPREWGICSHEWHDIFGLTRSGLFLAKRVFREDTETYTDRWRCLDKEPASFPPGKWLYLKWHMSNVIEFFHFLANFSHAFDPAEEFVYALSASPLTGRVMVTSHPLYTLQQPSRATEFRHGNTLTAAAIRAGWKDECAEVLFRFLELFDLPNMPQQKLRVWIDTFKDTEWE